MLQACFQQVASSSSASAAYRLGERWREIISAHNVSALVSKGCCNKVPQTWWVETINICSLTLREFRKSKIKVFVRLHSLWRLQRRILLSSSSFWHSLACGSIRLISSHGLLCAFVWPFMCVSFKDTLSLFRCLNLIIQILISVTATKTLLPKQVALSLSDAQTWILRKHYSVL